VDDTQAINHTAASLSRCHYQVGDRIPGYRLSRLRPKMKMARKKIISS
jgi:hypothetical protein